MSELFEPIYIDGRQLWKKFDQARFFVDREDRDIAQEAVEDMMEDGLDIVYCRNCVFCLSNPKDGAYVCSSMTNPNYVNATHFCSYGERKE